MLDFCNKSHLQFVERIYIAQSEDMIISTKYCN
jgi:hypothetical protein